MKKLLPLILFISASALLHAQVITLSNPELIPMELVRISTPLRDLPESPLTQAELNGPRIEHENPTLENQMKVVNYDALPRGADPALQTNYPNGNADFTTATIL